MHMQSENNYNIETIQEMTKEMLFKIKNNNTK